MFNIVCKKWINDDGFSFLVRKNGDPDNIKDRVAAIEKTPRVRIDSHSFGLESESGFGCSCGNSDAWLYGSKGSNSEDINSRHWCENMLRQLGYKLVN